MIIIIIIIIINLLLHCANSWHFPQTPVMHTSAHLRSCVGTEKIVECIT